MGYQVGEDGLSVQDAATLDASTLTPLSPEVISRQATINIGARRSPRGLDDALGPSIARPDGVGTPREAFAPPANARSRSLAPRVIFPAGARSRGSVPRRSIS
jgi:hypothetical protein